VKTILVVDDEAAIRSTLEQVLAYEGYRILLAANGPAALKILATEIVDAVLLDIKMPGMDGFEVLEQMAAAGRSVPVVVISGHGTVETAVEAVRRGAYDFLEKPLDRARLLVTLENCLEHQRLLTEKEALKERGGFRDPLIGDCAPMRAVRGFVEKVAPTDATVLITGENGTGKELVVRAIHERSLRREQPLVEVNCAAIPRELVESELFGHEKGSFTGADRMRIGKFEQADGGTLFLDEIGDMSEEAQAKALKAIEENRFERVGSSQTLRVNVRIIAASNRDLAGPGSRFRQDLFFRLNVLSIHLPPLREREGDVPQLLDYFMRTLALTLKTEPKEFSPEAMAVLADYTWPGNVRELRNLVERLLILAPGPVVRTPDLPLLPGTPTPSEESLDLFGCKTFGDFKARAEAIFLQAKLRENHYNVSRTAERLGMQRSNLYKKITRYRLRTQPPS
jgi:two-component system nitrogen regulation response regulator NtrX